MAGIAPTTLVRSSSSVRPSRPASSVVMSSAPLTTSTIISTYKPLANANEARPSSTSSRPPAQTHTENEQSNDTSGTPKSVPAGAAIGGVLGLLFLLASVLFFMRWYLAAKRRNKIQGFSTVFFWRRPPPDETEVVHRVSTHYTASEVSPRPPLSDQ